MATREAIDTMIDDSESGASVSEVFEESGGLSKSEEDPTDSVVKYKYKPRPLTPEDREKLVVEQAELLAFFTLLYSTTALAIAVRLMTKDDEEKEFQKGFDTYSNELANFCDFRLQEALSSLLSVANQVVTFPNSSTADFPTIKDDEFLKMTRVTLDRTILTGVRWNPVVVKGQVGAWQNYTNQETFSKTSPLPVVVTQQVAPEGLLREVDANENLVETPYYAKVLHDTEALGSAAFTAPRDLSTELNLPTSSPTSFVVVPVFRNVNDDVDELVGYLDGVVNWNELLSDNLPGTVGGIAMELGDSCGTYHRFLVQGTNSSYIGPGKFDKTNFQEPEVLRVSNMHSFDFGLNLPEVAPTDVCIPIMTLHPTSEFRDQYRNGESMLYTSLVLVVFLITTLIFSCYFCLVRRRRSRLETTVENTVKIVTNVFPGAAGKRILAEAQENKPAASFGAKAELKQILGNNNVTLAKHYGPVAVPDGKPIADLFPSCTIVFADIVGFTAWSSTREPSQVFMLLESIYQEFDSVAHRRRVFKVETVGDCYVAVCGLPDPRKNHAVVTARFANDILFKFNSLTKQLEMALGPGTGDLGLRVGIHSGPVTAGVLRGERARFQLFGDTINTTARMESTGERNRIQLSQETAALLTSASKGHWCIPREDPIFAKGKGELKTFWLQMRSGTSNSFESSQSSDMTSTGYDSGTDALNDEITEYQIHEQQLAAKVAQEKRERLVNWNTELLLTQLKEIVCTRMATGVVPDPIDEICDLEMETLSKSGAVLAEVQDIIRLPRFVARNKHVSSKKIEIREDVRIQLRDYVDTLSALYQDNAFHNFEHASHVTMSVDKLFSRIVAPDIAHDNKTDLNSILHDHTYGISSDPLTRFAVYLSALVHDADHPGVPNAQLCKEQAPVAKAYDFQSVAEQNSVELAWQLLMKDSYRSLRHTIYTTKNEFNRFRQLVVNTVMATDIMDKSLGKARKNRWNEAFHNKVEESVDIATNRKATIVIEHLIQASDVAHTMQHWHVYRKWNQRLFTEMYQAWLDGRSETNPADNWYKGELGFFDFYIIPLAKKLADCGVFGVSSDEYLNYAQNNRAEWERKGELVVAELLQQVRGMKAVSTSSSGRAARTDRTKTISPS